MNTFILFFSILAIFLCGIGVVVCLAMFADRLDELMKGNYQNEDEQRDV